MINTSHIDEKIKLKCKENGNRYLRHIDFLAVKTLRQLMEALPSDAVLIGANLINAVDRNDKNGIINPIMCTPKSYIKYTLNNYVIYLEFGYFWMFEGVSLSAYPIVNDHYQIDRYSINVLSNPSFDELFELALNPRKIYYEQMPVIPYKSSNIAYIDHKRSIKPTFYAQ